jgi:hypothetical protein
VGTAPVHVQKLYPPRPAQRLCNPAERKCTKRVRTPTRLKVTRIWATPLFAGTCGFQALNEPCGYANVSIYFYHTFPNFLISWFPSPLVRPPLALVKDDPNHSRTASVRLPLEFLCRCAHLSLPVFFPVLHKAAFGEPRTNRALSHGGLDGPRRHPGGFRLLLKKSSLYSRPLHVRI